MRVKHNSAGPDLTNLPWTTKSAQVGSVYVKSWETTLGVYNEYAITAIYEMGAGKETRLRVINKYNNRPNDEFYYTIVETEATDYPYATVPHDVNLVSPWGHNMMVTIEQQDIQLLVSVGNGEWVTVG